MKLILCDGWVRCLALLAFATIGVDCSSGYAADNAGRSFYVDAERGQDNHDGHSSGRAWQSLERVNAAELKPGDTVRFKRGGVWRGSLVPISGDDTAPVTYTSFGEGPKPLILGSLPRDRAQDWVKAGENIWATLPMEYRLGQELLDLRGGTWRLYQEGGAKAELTQVADPSGQTGHIVCTDGGTAANQLQLWGPELRVEKGACLVLTYRARSTRPFRFPGLGILRGDFPYTGFAKPRPAQRELSPEWETCQAVIQVVQSSESGRLHINLGGVLPPGAVFDFQPQSLHLATPNIADPLTVDVGNIIFDGGAVCGWKKWSLDDLTKAYDYYYDGASQRVYLYSDSVPTARHRSIELALARHVINQGDKHHVVYQGLAVMNGAAHGFGGGNTHHLVIRDCDLGYIGGAHQHTRPDGRPVRYGNAIEFWGAAHDNLVEGCRIWEVYDAALTNQGRGADSKQSNITYRNNFIRNAEYSFEYWNNPETAVTENIRFINNTCVDAGCGWAHAQRPDRNGSHLMFYTNMAATKGLEVKYNIFSGATDWGSRYSSGWKVLPEMDYNLWFSKTGVMAYWFRQKIAGFEEYRQTTGLDCHSRFADPQFVDPSHGDYRPGPDSPARTLRPDSGPVGADLTRTPQTSFGRGRSKSTLCFPIRVAQANEEPSHVARDETRILADDGRRSRLDGVRGASPSPGPAAEAG